MKKKLAAIISAIVMSLGLVGVWGVPVMAGECAGVNTSIINCSSGEDDGKAVEELLLKAAKIMIGLVIVLAVLGVIIAGYQYMMSSGDAAKTAKAKRRLYEIVIGLVVFSLMYAGLEFLIPGF